MGRLKRIAWLVGPVVFILVAGLFLYPSLWGQGYPAADSDFFFAASQADLVSLNTATAAELSVLPGIGAKRAAAIVEYRQENGPFTQPEQLLEVTGIGPAILEGLRAYIRM